MMCQTPGLLAAAVNVMDGFKPTARSSSDACASVWFTTFGTVTVTPAVEPPPVPPEDPVVGGTVVLMFGGNPFGPGTGGYPSNAIAWSMIGVISDVAGCPVMYFPRALPTGSAGPPPDPPVMYASAA